MAFPLRPGFYYFAELSEQARAQAAAFMLEDQHASYRVKLAECRQELTTQPLQTRVNEPYRFPRLASSYQLLHKLQTTPAYLVDFIEGNLQEFFADGRPHYYMRPSRPAPEVK